MADNKIMLYEFINAYIFKNTLIRIWKPEDLGKPYGSKVCLTDRPLMEWEVNKIPLLRSAYVYGVTDIVCDTDREAVNIVIRTQATPEDVREAVAAYKWKYESEKRYLADGCE